MRVVTWYAGKWVNDRRVQLAIVGFVWSGTGYAGRTMLTMTLVIAFLAGAGSNGDRHGNGRPRGSRERERGGVTAEDEAMDGEGRAAKGGERREGVTVAGGVTIEEMPPSPAAVAPLGRVDPNVSAVSSSRGGGAKQRTPVAAASCGRGRFGEGIARRVSERVGMMTRLWLWDRIRDRLAARSGFAQADSAFRRGAGRRTGAAVGASRPRGEG